MMRLSACIRHRIVSIQSISCALVVVLVSLSVLSTSTLALVPTSTRITQLHRPFISPPLALSTNNDEDERQKLLEKARQLREEVRNLEEKVRATKADNKSSAPLEGASKPIMPVRPKITDLKGSTWTISYRFSSQPKDSDDDDKDTIILPKYYSGKFTLLLKADGYSELIGQSSTNDPKLQITKVWGWDEEYSQQDQHNYLLFSMDVQLPDSDPKLPNVKERYYFQAQIQKRGGNGLDGEISLKDGTVTVKKDITEKTKGRWGLFQVAGILSQFRYVGDFVAKSSS